MSSRTIEDGRLVRIMVMKDELLEDAEHSRVAQEILHRRSFERYVRSVVDSPEGPGEKLAALRKVLESREYLDAQSQGESGESESSPGAPVQAGSASD